MFQIVRDEIVDGKRIIEYSKNRGISVSHTIVTDADEEGKSETITIPKSPIKILEEENQELKEDVETLSDALNEFMELTLGGDL